MKYTSQEYTDMVVMYGLAGENTHRAAAIYAERFPERARKPCDKTILRVVQRLRETGCLVHNQGNRSVRFHVRDEERILETFSENPTTSVRRVAHEFGFSRNAVHRVLRRNGLRPFHYQRVQQLLPRDYQPRINFCEGTVIINFLHLRYFQRTVTLGKSYAGFLAQCRRNLSFPDIILWTDEATFTPNGVFNSRNYLYWGEENPHLVRQGAFQFRWSINVWAGIIGNQIIGPYFLPLRLNGEIYANFLKNSLVELLEDIPFDVRTRMIYQHDGAPAHFSREVREILNARFSDRWMGRGGPITWPARSPDLNVLDFFVWGHIKNLVEDRRHGTQNEVREAIIAAFDTITPDMAHRATRDVIRRAKLCLQEGGQHFEQFSH